MFSHLVDWKDTVTDKVGFRGSELREYETRTITQDKRGRKVNCLEVLGLAGCRRDADFLFANERVDSARLADVWVSHQADN